MFYLFRILNKSEKKNNIAKLIEIFLHNFTLKYIYIYIQMLNFLESKRSNKALRI